MENSKLEKIENPDLQEKNNSDLEMAKAAYIRWRGNANWDRARIVWYPVDGAFVRGGNNYHCGVGCVDGNLSYWEWQDGFLQPGDWQRRRAPKKKK